MTFPPNDSEQLARLGELRRSGQISDDEYQRHRAEIIARMIQAPAQPQAGYPPPAPPVAPAPQRQRRHPGRWIAAAVAAVIVIAVVAAAASSGSGSGKKQGVAQTPARTSLVDAPSIPSDLPSEDSVDSAEPSTPSESLAHVGDVIEINDTDNDVHIDVTVVAVARATHATDDFSTPDRGNRYYAARFKVKNLGTATYSDDIDNDVNVSDTADQQFDPDIVDSIAAGPLFPNTFHIPPGGSRTGWMVFQVPLHARIVQAQYVVSNGYGDGAQWIIP